VDGTANVEPIDICRLRVSGVDTLRGITDADIGFEQFDQVRSMKSWLCPRRCRGCETTRSTAPHARRNFARAIAPFADPRGDIFTVRQRMTLVDDELETFGEQRPGIEPVHSSPISAAMRARLRPS